MLKKPHITKEILKSLANKRAYTLNSIKDGVVDKISSTGRTCGDNKKAYSVNRALKNMAENGLIETLHSDNDTYLRITKEGHQKLVSLKLDEDTVIVPSTWDGQWRMILIDIPESRKNERESLRYLLKKAGFVCLKNSAWISPFPLEHLFMNIKKDLGLETEMIIITTNSIDEITEKELKKIFQIK
jgi:DNA-binding transcriptional regulator PaaX